MKEKTSSKRVLLKISGEALMGSGDFGLQQEACHDLGLAIKEVHEKGVQLGIVMGGGNIFRGIQAKKFGFEQTPADHVGMLATCINGLVLQQTLLVLGCKVKVMSALPFNGIMENYSWLMANEYLENGVIVIFVGGTGNPYFTTDTAAALRASEIRADILLKGTKVDGVYDKDPMKFPGAKKYPKLSYEDALTQKLNVMDATAVALCRENKIPIYVFNLLKKGSLVEAIFQKTGGSLVEGE
ncbi:MAG: UMP kinase [Chlamydiae bacterium]|jgi:uridylate kinase|nr:UMP kinase [Chlamydiota bacterium]